MQREICRSIEHLLLRRRKRKRSVFARLLNMMVLLRFLMGIEVFPRQRLYMIRVNRLFREITIRSVVRCGRHLLRRWIFLCDFGVCRLFLCGFLRGLFLFSFLVLTRRAFVLNHAHAPHFHRRRSPSFQIGRIVSSRHCDVGLWVTSREATRVKVRVDSMKACRNELQRRLRELFTRR